MYIIRPRKANGIFSAQDYGLKVHASECSCPLVRDVGDAWGTYFPYHPRHEDRRKTDQGVSRHMGVPAADVADDVAKGTHSLAALASMQVDYARFVAIHVGNQAFASRWVEEACCPPRSDVAV